MAKRRSVEEIARERASTWTLLGRNGWALNTACTKCGTVTHCRGRTRDAVRCEPCHMRARR